MQWFEGLRPHLPATGEAAKYRTGHGVVTRDRPGGAAMVGGSQQLPAAGRN
jgi:hypothetical protein